MKEKYHMNLAEVGGRLRAAREALKLTMEQMRDITGYSKSLISAAENGKKKPSTIYLFAMFDKFNVNINYIFSGKGHMFLEPGEEKNVSIPFLESNENIREFLYYFFNSKYLQYRIMSEYIKIYSESSNLIDDEVKKKESSEKK